MKTTPDEEDEKEWDKTAAHAQASTAYNPDYQSRKRFPEIRGLCRTCEHALIRRRQYSEIPHVICKNVYENPHRVPLDVMECSGYRREGQMDLRDIHLLGIIIDSRDRHGQYL